MRKFTLYRFAALSICLIVVIAATAQDLSENQIDSIAQYKLAEAYYDQGENGFGQVSIGEQINLFHKADSIFRRLEVWDKSVSSLLWLCYLYQFERGYEEMDRLSNDALNIARSYLGKDNRYLGAVLNNRGGVMDATKKDYKYSIDLYKESIEVDEKNQVSLLEIGTTYFNIGLNYLEVGDYDQAIDQFQNTLRINLDSLHCKSRDKRIIPGTYNQLGICYSKKKLFEQSIYHYKQGLKFAKEVQPNIREIDQIILYLYQNLAELYLKTDQLDLAKKYIESALDFQRGQAFIKDAYTFQLQGQLFLKEKEYTAAEEAFQKCTKAAQLEYKDFEKHPEIGLTYYHAGNVKLAQNVLDSALHYYQLALIHNSSNFESNDPNESPGTSQLINPLYAIDILEGKGKAFARRFEKNGQIADLNSAFTHYGLAIQAISKARLSYNAEGSKHTLAEKVVPIYEGAIKTAFLLNQTTGEQNWLEKAFQFAEGNKAAALLDGIQESQALNTGNIPDSLLSMEYDLKVEMAFYEKLIYENSQRKSPGNSTQTGDWENKLFDLKENYLNLIDQFETAYPDYYALKYAQTLTSPKEVQKYLKREAVLEFFVGFKHIYVFTITKEKIHCIQIPKEADFEKDIRSLRKLIGTKPDSKSISQTLSNFITVSERIYHQYIQAAIREIPASINHLIVIPDDLLAFIPFSVLIDSPVEQGGTSFKHLPYLSNRFGVSYNYSTALWLKHLEDKPNSATKKFIGFAPEFSGHKNAEKLSPLSCNTTEIERVSKVLNTEGTHFSEMASLENFKNKASEYQIIHLATHTTLDNQNSAFNKIYFSDQSLSQNDLYHLKLNASLSVLSACNTGSGELVKGEGVMSLSRGFIYAGCPSILMSLWSVDDCTTADIMFNYYQSLNNGNSKELAIQTSKSQYLDQTRDILASHPYYWAAFIQYGNTEPLDLNTFKFKYYILGGALLLGLAILLLFRFRKPLSD